VSEKKHQPHGFSSPYVWAFTTYFTEGFPFIMIRTVSSVFFRDMKVSLESIGLTSLFGLPWILKFLWGPLVDAYSTKRRWLLNMQAALLVILVMAAIAIPLPNNVQMIAVLFFIGSFIAATHDIAIDGYYMEALDKAGQAKYVGYRTMAFRIAMMTGTAVIVTIGTTIGWFLAFWVSALIFGAFLVYHYFFLPEVETDKKPFKTILAKLLHRNTVAFILFLTAIVYIIRTLYKSDSYAAIKEQFPILKKIYFSHWVVMLLFLSLIVIGLMRNRIKALILKDPDSHYSMAFVSFMDKEKISTILAFIILLRAGEWTLSTMVSPFIVDVGIKVHYGWISGWVGLPASIAGALLGGYMISRFSLKKVMWPFILAQNFTNVIYMALAIHLANFVQVNTGADEVVGIGINNLALVAGTHAFDQFAGGLGTAVLMTYLMRICNKEYKAAHYAIGTGLMSVSGLFAGVLSGFIAQSFGYAWLFGASFIISIPAMILIPFLPNTEDKLVGSEKLVGSKE
jgi:MFS transporter, PAT family, beta-lactamase induction signal transducer AmpG